MLDAKEVATKEEFRELLREPNYLPTHEDVKNAFPDIEEPYSSEAKEWFTFFHEKGKEIYELFNKEHLEAFSNYLTERLHAYGATPDKPLTIVECGAGNGKLSHYLRRFLSKKAPGLARVIATDSGEWNIAPQFPVEKMDYKTAVDTFNPDIVIQSWLCLYQDTTSEFRKNPNVKEYILIGDSECCGDPIETWGQFPHLYEYVEEGLITPDDLEGLQVHNEDDIEIIPFYRLEGFTYENLEEVSNFNLSRTDYSLDPINKNSSTISFKRAPDTTSLMRDGKEKRKKLDLLITKYKKIKLFKAIIWSEFAKQHKPKDTYLDEDSPDYDNLDGLNKIDREYKEYEKGFVETYEELVDRHLDKVEQLKQWKKKNTLLTVNFKGITREDCTVAEVSGDLLSVKFIDKDNKAIIMKITEILN